MKSGLLSQAFNTGRRCVTRCAPFIAVFALTAQVVAQNPLIPDSTDRAADSPQTVAALAQIEAPAPAPAPVQELASLANREAASYFSLAAAQNGGQSSSQNAPANQTAGNVTKTTSKPPHHALGVTLAVVGVAALVSGVVLFAGENSISLCNGASHGCNEARDTGIALIPIGAGVAAVGFYFQFHR
jgi:hypothetical protein